MDKELSGKKWSAGYQRKRKKVLILIHAYIVLHLIAWYILKLPIWGKTAMVGALSLLIGNINAAAIMFAIILLSIFLYGRFFCGWLCHLRGVIEFSDWLLQKYKVQKYIQLRNPNILLNSRYRWSIRLMVLLILFVPVLSFYLYSQEPFHFFSETMAPLADLAGKTGKLFIERSPIDTHQEWTWMKVLLTSGFFILIFSSIGIVMNLFFGQGAFCRILCPYSLMFMPLMNLNPWQKKITRIGECTGCRKCSKACPQGIDVSREIFHYDGKVTNVECIKCFRCIDVCKDNILADSRNKAVTQIKPRIEYIRTPWKYKHSKDLQQIEQLAPWWDLLSIVCGMVIGSISSSLGGFWFYIGFIWGFISFRYLFRSRYKQD